MDLLMCPIFVHNEQRDGRIVSICKTCFVMVATSFWEFELERREEEHVCNPAAALAQFNRTQAAKAGTPP